MWRTTAILMLIASTLPVAAETLWITYPGQVQAEECVASNDAERYCILIGGCPVNGFCQFLSGRAYPLWYIFGSEARWELGAYDFLNSDDCYPVVPLNLSNSTSIRLQGNASPCATCVS